MMRHLTLLALLPLAACKAQPQSLPVQTITLQTQSDTLTIQAEIADEETERGTGLMHRTELCPSCGMLFVWPAATPVAMWMKDTLIPLDMLFIQRGKIIHIATAIPQDLTPISAGTEVDMVLELPGGYAEKNNVHLGDTLQF